MRITVRPTVMLAPASMPKISTGRGLAEVHRHDQVEVTRPARKNAVSARSGPRASMPRCSFSMAEVIFSAYSPSLNSPFSQRAG